MLAGCKSAPPPLRVLADIGRLADRRELGSGRLESALQHPQVRVRLAAARALGRVNAPEGVPALVRAASDTATAVCAEALFALGQSREPAAIAALRAHLADGDAGVRAAAVAGLGRTEASEHWQEAAALLSDPAAAVRGAAALALVRLAGDRLRGVGLVGETARGQIVRDLGAQLVEERDRDAAWRIVYALAHMVEPAAEPALLLAARPDAPWASRWSRLFATRGLGALPATRTGRERLLANASDADPRIAYEAVRALGERGVIQDGQTARARHDDPAVIAALLAILAQHTAAHVRAAAASSLSAFGGHAAVLPAVQAACRDASTTVRAAAIETVGAIAGAVAVAAALREAGPDDWRLQVAAARAFGACRPPGTAQIVELFDGTEDARVRVAALEATASAGERDLAALAVRACAIGDAALRDAAARCLAALRPDGALDALAAAYRDSSGEVFVTARATIARAIGGLGREQRAASIAFLREALRDEAITVRKTVARELRILGEPPGDDAIGPPRDLVTPVLGQDIPWKFLEQQPRLVFVTTRGEFTITLQPEIAPVHCFNIVTLAETGAYRGRIFHRIVPNFVAQGGDARGDGYGNRAYHGRHIRDEIGPLTFDAGVVGMPKSEDPDTGGDQIFVTTVPTPHLDGRYTAFGRVTAGLDVVEALEVGDAITDTVVKFD